MKKKLMIFAVIITLLIAGTLFLKKENIKNSITNNTKKILKSSSPEVINTENENDNWELGLVFYDSSVDNGKTALTEINWDASDGGYGQGETRIITVQINYKNISALKTYDVGELEISIPNLIYNTSSAYNHDSAYWKSSVIIGANDSTHSGYDWNLTGPSYIPTSQNIYKFTNAFSIEEKANFEGSIQIQYTIQVPGENVAYSNPEQYEDECTHSLNRTLKAEVKDICESNEIVMNYRRTYIHPWKERTYTVTKNASKISSYDGLGENASNYIWVKYSFDYTLKDEDINAMWRYPDIDTDKSPKIYKDHIPDNCVVYDIFENKLEADNNIYSFPLSTSTIYVGYPKEFYNEENETLKISNTVELWGTYNNKTEPECLATDSVSVDLSEYSFSYTGNLYSIDKVSSSGLRYQDIINENKYNYIRNEIIPVAYYTGNPMTIKFGDDILTITNNEGEKVKLKEDEYYFDSISWDNDHFKNGNDNIIKTDKYDCELWVKFKNSNSYELYDTFKNKSKTWKFSDDIKVVSFYFIINDVKECLVGKRELVKVNTQWEWHSPINARTILLKKDIPESGTVYNFDYIEVYFKDANNNFILQNNVGLDDYSSEITKQMIAQYDLETYGHYMQRDFSSARWNYFHITQPNHELSCRKNFSAVTQDVANEVFYGSCTIQGTIRARTMIEYYPEQYDETYAVKGFKLYDLLPLGMELDSTSDEILASIEYRDVSNYLMYDSHFNKITMEKFNEILDTDIVIKNNWKNTGRTKIEIEVKFKEPIFLLNGSKNSISEYAIKFNYKFKISYDSFLEYGSIWNNYCYANKLENQENGITLGGNVKDNGYYDEDAIDINENGNTEENLTYNKATTTITSVISTHQDLTKYVQTDQSNFTTGRVKATPGSQYTYKLRVRSGSNDITNLVIYDSIEEYLKDNTGNMVPSYGDNKHWNGEFLGIDTSYAEKKGYKVKTYYSENVKPGNLKEDDSWQEYTDSVDKTKVKSLAFEYLDLEGNPAILPENSLTYVLIHLKAPDDEDLITLAYGACWTEWNAIDEFGNPVDYITGIHSNTVKVSTNSYFNLKVNKVWDDFDNVFDFRPESINIVLCKNGEEVDRKQLTKENTEIVFEGLLLDDLESYTVREEVDDKTKEFYDMLDPIKEDDDRYTITNKLKQELLINISGNKSWIGDVESERPETITINLLRNGELYKTTTTDSSKEWNYTFENIPTCDKDSNEYEYRVEEVPVENYITEYEDFNIKNIFNKVEDVSGQKTWEDNNNQDGVRPNKITINLLANGEKVDSKQVTENEEWKWTFTDLPKYKNGAEIVYTITEDEVEGYTAQVNGYNVTNTHEVEKISIEGSKTWNDNNNQDGVRPNTITINLLANGEKVDSKQVTEKEEWKWIFTDLPKYKEGTEIVYTITEDQIEGYTSQVNGYNVTNIHVADQTEVTVQKFWNDYNNFDGIRPQEIQVQLYANKNAYGEPVTLNFGMDWKYTWTNLPKKQYGEDVKYTVKELGRVVGYEVSYSEDTFTITNTHDPVKVSIQGQKTWEDNENQDGIRPQSITVNLYADDEKIASQVVTEKDNWSWRFDDLYKYDAGAVVDYYITEDTVEGYETRVNGFNITNIHEAEKISIEGNKTWEDNNNQDGVRPQSITINLFANGEKIDTKQVTENEEWKWNFENLPKYKNGVEIEYTISEENVENYTSKVEGYNIINTHTPGETGRTVQKVWQDSNNQDGIRPESIEVQLLSNGEACGEKVTLSEENEWKYTWEKLPEKKEGVKVEYTLEEIGEVPGYEVTYDNESFIIINTHEPEKIEVSGSKTWNDNNNQDALRPDEITINLFADGEKIDTKQVTEKHEWKWTFTDLPKYKEGTEIVYTITEDEVEGYTSQVEGYNVINTHEPEKIEVSGTKTWEDNNNQDGIRPEKVTINLLANGEKIDSKEITENEEWKWTFIDLPKYKEGTEIVYSITEDEVTGYMGKIDGYDVINIHEPEKTEVSGSKTWEDNNNQDKIRPEKITINLLANGEKILSKEVTEKEGWKWKFEELDKYKDGKEIKYTITEEKVEGYESKVEGYNVINTHKHVEEKPKPTEPEKPIKPAEPEKPTPPVTPPPVVTPPPIINNNYNNVTNNVSTTNQGNTDSGKRLPDTGDILPIATIGTIITVALLNIVVTLRKKKRVGKHIK